MFTYSLPKHQVVLLFMKRMLSFISTLHANGRANEIKINEKRVYFRVKCSFKSVKDREFGLALEFSKEIKGFSVIP